MAKAKKAAPNTKEKDTQEFFEALALMGQEKGIPLEYLVEKIKTAIALAVKKDPAGSEESIVVIDPESKRFYVAMRKEVVEEVEDPATQITIEDAVKYDKKALVGDMVEIPLEPKKFGRIAAQSAKHVIRQGIREAEKGLLFQEFRSRQHDIVTGTVLRSDVKRGIVTLEIGSSEAVLLKSEQVPGEEFVDGQKVRVYVVDAQNGEKGPRLMISRTHPNLVKRLFEMQVPEIYDGVVQIRAISREAGSRSKLAVTSRDENVDPVGACIGPKGIRVTSIVEELGGEKIDVVPYSEDPAEFVSAALSPATVLSVEILEMNPPSCRVTVPDHQLSLAIGNKGQNARLAAKLTGWKIDIRPESGFYGEEPEEDAGDAPEEPEEEA
ncbi:MAG: transcription termination/antitermination protein NusA [Angelakisella sp.]|jgi:N utilization substance protein A|nr:transcription termination/antitermination protein NusA [Angelakisella sp.]MCI9528943.1 transcription termination/antitermination protein NusA [Angelakisella sp.]